MRLPALLLKAFRRNVQAERPARAPSLPAERPPKTPAADPPQDLDERVRRVGEWQVSEL